MKIRITTSTLATIALWSHSSIASAQGLIGAPRDCCRGGYSNELPINAEAFKPVDTMAVILTIATFMVLHFVPLPAKREIHLLKDCLQLCALIVVPLAAEQLLTAVYDWYFMQYCGL